LDLSLNEELSRSQLHFMLKSTASGEQYFPSEPNRDAYDEGSLCASFAQGVQRADDLFNDTLDFKENSGLWASSKNSKSLSNSSTPSEHSTPSD